MAVLRSVPKVNVEEEQLSPKSLNPATIEQLRQSAIKIKRASLNKGQSRADVGGKGRTDVGGNGGGEVERGGAINRAEDDGRAVSSQWNAACGPQPTCSQTRSHATLRKKAQFFRRFLKFLVSFRIERPPGRVSGRRRGIEFRGGC